MEKKTTLTNDDIKAYVDYPNTCPYCSSENLDGGIMDTLETDSASRDVDCVDCGASWTEIFKLTHILPKRK